MTKKSTAMSATDQAVLSFHRDLMIDGWVIDPEYAPPVEVVAAYRRIVNGVEQRAELVLTGALVDFRPVKAGRRP